MQTWRKRILAHFERKFNRRKSGAVGDSLAAGLEDQGAGRSLARTLPCALTRSASLIRSRGERISSGFRPMATSSDAVSATCTLDRRLNTTVSASLLPLPSPSSRSLTGSTSTLNSIDSASNLNSLDRQRLEDRLASLERRLAALERKQQDLASIEEQLLQRKTSAAEARQVLRNLEAAVE